MIAPSLDSTVAIARALGHPARLRTLGMLSSGELCVCQITAVLGLAPSTVSAHLRELRNAGLTAEHKEGRWVYVGLTDDGTIRPWIDDALEAIAADPRFEADDRMVEEIRRMPLVDLCGLGYREATAKLARSSPKKRRQVS